MNLRTRRSPDSKSINKATRKNHAIMKTNNNLITKISLYSGLALGLTFAAWLPAHANAAEQMKGAEHLLHLQGIKTKAEADALKPGDTMAMVCTKCKTVIIERVTLEKGHIKHLTPGEKHLCT